MTYRTALSATRWAGKTQAKVGTQLLNRNTYTGSGIHTGVLSKVTYGNGDTVCYSYDAFNRITRVSINGEAAPWYTDKYIVKETAGCCPRDGGQGLIMFYGDEARIEHLRKVISC